VTFCLTRNWLTFESGNDISCPTRIAGTNLELPFPSRSSKKLGLSHRFWSEIQWIKTHDRSSRNDCWLNPSEPKTVTIHSSDWQNSSCWVGIAWSRLFYECRMYLSSINVLSWSQSFRRKRRLRPPNDLTPIRLRVRIWFECHCWKRATFREAGFTKNCNRGRNTNRCEWWTSTKCFNFNSKEFGIWFEC
jgi:hypothetical protein